MNMVEQLDIEAAWVERQAEAAEAELDRRREQIDKDWYSMLTQRSIDAKTGVKQMATLGDVMSEACARDDPRIYRALMQSVVHCAATGRVEAVEALEQVKDFFIAWRMEAEQ